MRKQLLADAWFRCVEDTSKRVFWLFWGSPALESKYGITCFGDIELQHNRKLVVTGMSETRMASLLGILAEMIGFYAPILKRDPVYGVDKRTGKRCVVPVQIRQ